MSWVRRVRPGVIRPLDPAFVRNLLGADERTPWDRALQTVGTPDYGSCFFWSVLHAVDPAFAASDAQDQRRAVHALRRRLAAALARDGALPSDVAATADPKAWAEEPTIRRLGELLGVALLVVRATRRPSLVCKVFNGSAMARPTLVLLWIDGGHFEPVLRRADGGGAWDPRIPAQRRFLEQLMTRAERRCAPVYGGLLRGGAARRRSKRRSRSRSRRRSRRRSRS